MPVIGVTTDLWLVGLSVLEDLPTFVSRVLGLQANRHEPTIPGTKGLFKSVALHEETSNSHRGG